MQPIQNDELKLKRFVKIDIRGVEFNILKYIGNQIPFIKILIDCDESENKINDLIIIDEVSPLFFNILIEYLKNEEHLDSFKLSILKFETENVKKWLKYLGMDKLFRKIFGFRSIDNKLIVKKIFYGYDDLTSEKVIMYILHDGSCYSPFNIIKVDETLVCVSVHDGFDDKKNEGYYVISQIEKNPGAFIYKENIFEHEGFYFITLASALEYDIMFCDKEIKKSFF